MSLTINDEKGKRCNLYIFYMEHLCRFLESKFKLKMKESYPFWSLVTYNGTISVRSEKMTPLGSEGFQEIIEVPCFLV